MTEEFYNKEYNPTPKILNIPDCLKVYGSFFSEDDLVLHQDITLFDPITLKRLAVPCRSINCLHFQAFDYESYLELNKKKCPCQFLCPICKEGANPTKIYIDSIWLCLLRHYTKNDKIRIGSDGMCSVYSLPKALDVICIDESDEEGGRTSSEVQSKPISIAQFLNQKLPKITLNASIQINVPPSMILFDDLFDCNIDDVLYFVNNCTVEDLRIIPSIGEYHAEKMIKARPFICSDFITLRHDLMLKLNRLKLSAAQIMIENLERVVKNKINLIKIRYAEAINKFQIKTNDALSLEGKERSASPSSANLSKSELKRLKRMRKADQDDDNDETFSPIKGSKKDKKVLKIEGNEVSYPAHSESILLEGDFLLDKRKKNKQPPSDLDQIIQPPKLSKKQKHQVDSSTSSSDTMNDSNPSPRKKSKKSKYIENESAIVASLSHLIAQADSAERLRKEPISSLSPLKTTMPSPRTLPKKIYFNIDDDIVLSDERQRQENSSKSEIPLPSESRQPSPLVQSRPSVTGTTIKPKRKKDEYEDGSVKLMDVSNSPAPLHQNTGEIVEKEPTNAIMPSLLFDDDDIFGCGFISTTTRSFDDATHETKGINTEIPVSHTHTPVTSTKGQKEGQSSRTEQSKHSSGSRKHIRFSDDDSDTTTQTNSSHNDYSDGGSSSYQPSVMTSSSSGGHSSTVLTERNHLPLLPVFNASQPSSSQRKSSSSSSLTGSISSNVQNFVPFSPQKQVKPTFQPNTSKVSKTQPPSIQPQRINKPTNSQQPNSKSILELMISEFATDDY